MNAYLRGLQIVGVVTVVSCIPVVTLLLFRPTPPTVSEEPLVIPTAVVSSNSLDSADGEVLPMVPLSESSSSMSSISKENHKTIAPASDLTEEPRSAPALHSSLGTQEPLRTQNSELVRIGMPPECWQETCQSSSKLND